MSDDVISQMLDNHRADSWRDLSEGTSFEFDSPHLSPLERLEEYVDYCFETYPVVSNNLDRDQVQVCIADWDRRRGQARYNTRMIKREFGRQVRDSKWREHVNGHYSLFMATALVGVPPEDDMGVGWKPTARHELGHIIDHSKRGTSGHGPEFKAVMSKFGEEKNDGMSSHGYPPRYHR